LSITRGSLRQSAALYLLAFLAAVALAPHRHLNSFEDLVSDGPSDSGVFFQTSGPVDTGAGPRLDSVQIVNDDPCLACFHNDWAAEPLASLVLTPRFTPISLTTASRLDSIRLAPTRSSQSRAPPASA
jgi:hypothetical protein